MDDDNSEEAEFLFSITVSKPSGTLSGLYRAAFDGRLCGIHHFDSVEELLGALPDVYRLHEADPLA